MLLLFSTSRCQSNRDLCKQQFSHRREKTHKMLHSYKMTITLKIFFKNTNLTSTISLLCVKHLGGVYNVEKPSTLQRISTKNLTGTVHIYLPKHQQHVDAAHDLLVQGF